MDNVKIPTVTVECGFLSNDTVAQELTTDSYQSELAWGIYTGIIDYFIKWNKIKVQIHWTEKR